MTQTCLLSDGITRIRNSQLVKASSAVLLYSKLIVSFLDLLIAEGFLHKQEVFEYRKNIKKIKVYLKYTGISKSPAITEIVAVSKPGRRVYRGFKDIVSMKGGLGTIVVSTSRGIMSDHKARGLKVGGQILCKIF